VTVWMRGLTVTVMLTCNVRGFLTTVWLFNDGPMNNNLHAHTYVRALARFWETWSHHNHSWIIIVKPPLTDNGGSRVLWNFGKYIPDYTSSHHRIQFPSLSPMWEITYTYMYVFIYIYIYIYIYILIYLQSYPIDLSSWTNWDVLCAVRKLHFARKSNLLCLTMRRHLHKSHGS
jgi:hypothetical protein